MDKNVVFIGLSSNRMGTQRKSREGMWKEKGLHVSIDTCLYNSERPDNIASKRPLSFAATRSELPKHFFFRDQKEKEKRPGNCSE